MQKAFFVLILALQNNYSSIMNAHQTNNKQKQLKLIRNELKMSLEQYCATNNPYQTLSKTLDMHYPFVACSPSALFCKNSQTKLHSNRNSSKTKNSKLKIKRKTQSSIKKYDNIVLESSKIKIRRNHQPSPFNKQFSRYQLLQFFKTPTKRAPLDLNRQATNRDNFKQNAKSQICDVFCPFPQQSQTQMDYINEVKPISNEFASRNESSNLCGWSSTSAEKQLNLSFEPKAVSQHTIDIKLGNASSNQLKLGQINLESYENDSQEEEIDSFQQQSSKNCLKVYSIAVIAPSQGSVCQNPMSLIFNSEAKVINQPSIKCMSSSKDIQDNGLAQISGKQLEMRSGHSLKQKGAQNPSAKMVPIDQQPQLTDTVKQIDQKERYQMKQSLQSNGFNSSVPKINTLRSHYDSRNRIINGSSGQIQQKPLFLLTDSSQKYENQLWNGLGQTNLKESMKSELAMRGKKQWVQDKQNLNQTAMINSKFSLQNEHFIRQELEINLTNLSNIIERQLQI